MKSGNRSITRATSEMDRSLPCHIWSGSIGTVAFPIGIPTLSPPRSSSLVERMGIPTSRTGAVEPTMRPYAIWLRWGWKNCLMLRTRRSFDRSILGILAIVHGARTYGRILVEFTEDEVLELEKKAFGSPEDAG
jgi:hypothetical protein